MPPFQTLQSVVQDGSTRSTLRPEGELNSHKYFYVEGFTEEQFFFQPQYLKELNHEYTKNISKCKRKRSRLHPTHSKADEWVLRSVL